MKVKQITEFIKGMKHQQAEEFFYNFFARPKTFPKLKNKTAQNKVVNDKAVEYIPAGEFYDHIEMSGLKASAIISYGTDKNKCLKIFRHITFPYLRLKPDMTTSSLCHNFINTAEMQVDGVEILNEKIEKVRIKGNLELTTVFKQGLRLVRTEIICKDYPALLEKVTITNITANKINLTIFDNVKTTAISSKLCKNGKIKLVAGICGEHGNYMQGKESKLEKMLVANASFTFYNVFCAVADGEKLEIKLVEQIKKRDNYIYNAININTLKSPYPFINALYSHCQIRGNESIFETKAGILHSPGGGNYYASIWANDQLEYVAPITPFLGNNENIEAAKNAINLYLTYMDRSDTPFSKKKAVPSSIISGGLYPLGIAGDRGDSAMAGLGIAQFSLNYNGKEYIKDKLWAIEWCIDFCDSRKTSNGVIYSDSDELEGRFPSGKCNLSTNINYYLLLKYAVILENELGNYGKAEEFVKKQTELKNAVSKYFEGMVEGYDTYRYYEDNKVLRSWICLPLIAEIFDKKQGTLDALTKELYSDGKLRTAHNKKTVWDRSLLFALRGFFIAGEKETALRYLGDYSQNRLTGMHSPYPYEAYPEGNGAQLSGESILYIRIIIEGMFGIKFTGLGKLTIEPQIPPEGNYKLNKIYVRGKPMDIEVENGNITAVIDKLAYRGKDRLEINIE